MYPRLATVPDHSFFLFGPRATGKTTSPRHHLGDALWFNLLLEDDKKVTPCSQALRQPARGS